MLTKLLSLLLLISCSREVITRVAKPIKPMLKIAIIDTGFNLSDNRIPLCPTGHKDFTGQGINDVHGHGTHIAGLIETYSKDTPHCFVIIKYWHSDKIPETGKIAAQWSAQAFEHALSLDIDIINYSGGGAQQEPKERKAIKALLKRGTIIVAAAGNEYADLDKLPYYPACYDKRIVVISSYLLDNNNIPKRPASSNFGEAVDVSEPWQTWSYCIDPKAEKLCLLSGTSMSAAIATGKLVKCIYNNEAYPEICTILK